MKFHLFEKGLLKHPTQDNPCYRKVVCYGFFRYMKQKNSQLAISEFDRMIQHFHQKKLFVIPNYVEIYPLIMTDNGNTGYLVIEPSRACFPLVVRPQSHSQLNGVKNKSRKSGLEIVIDKLAKNKTNIFSIFEKYNDWDFELESELEKILEYPSVNKANDRILNDSQKKCA